MEKSNDELFEMFECDAEFFEHLDAAKDAYLDEVLNDNEAERCHFLGCRLELVPVLAFKAEPSDHRLFCNRECYENHERSLNDVEV